MPRIYLDHHATTPILPEVESEMARCRRESLEGLAAREIVRAARERVAALVGSRASEVVFTSGGTEANNHAIKGAAWSRKGSRNLLVTCGIEHRSVLEAAAWVERFGVRAAVLPVNGLGRLDPDRVRTALESPAFLASIQLANGEIGTTQPIAEIAAICRERGSLLHVDAAQAVGKISVSFRDLGADLMTLSAHKLHGPKGVGALVVRRGVRIEPLLHGESQESDGRAGAIDLSAIAGLGIACEAAGRDLAGEAARIAALRDRLWEGIRTGIPSVRRNGDPSAALPGSLSVTFAEVSAPALLQALRRFSLSMGDSARSSNAEPSHVLRAIGLCGAEADATVRFGLGRGNRGEEVDEAVLALAREVPRLRALGSGPSG